MGKLYADIKAYAAQVHACAWSEYKRPDKVWHYVEFGDRRASWKKGRRALLTRPLAEDAQWLPDFARPDTRLYTNLGRGEHIDVLLEAAGLIEWIEPEHIIRLHHSRGADELVHRALKEFGSETLPFKRFAANAAFYYTMAVAFFLYQGFKEDVTESVVPITSDPTKLRRRAINFAAKIVRTGDRRILKVTRATWDELQIPKLWDLSRAPPRFTWT
ncbi:MAG: transposase [Gemmatimonadetes bacterium]|nr:transposase [Gemmatimonadota bacterium]